MNLISQEFLKSIANYQANIRKVFSAVLNTDFVRVGLCVLKCHLWNLFTFY